MIVLNSRARSLKINSNAVTALFIARLSFSITESQGINFLL